jgi:tetratricopeptide (TPR) repeat protein
MRKNFFTLAAMLAFSLFTITSNAQNKTMTWTTKSDKAKTLCGEGVGLFFNIEFAQAYEKFNAALALDPDFTVALVFISNLTTGEAQKAFKARTVKSSLNKTAGEKLFASTTAEGSTDSSNRIVFDKLHTMFPDGKMLGAFYVFTRATPAEQFTTGEAYSKRFPDEAWVYNSMAYYYMVEKKDMEMAKKYFEKYMAMYPGGCNPYDSMGEYYFNNGDMVNSEKYYKLSLEKYPFNSSSVNKLQEIKKLKEKKVVN